MAKREKMEIKLLLAEALSLINHLERFKTFLKTIQSQSEITNVAITELELRSKKFTPLCDSYSKVMIHLAALSASDESPMTSDDFDNQYVELSVTASLMLEKQKVENNNFTPSPAHADRASSVKLPQIRLPTFSGNYIDFKGYFDSFMTLIHDNKSLSSVEKFIYLKSSLDHSALRVVSDIQMSHENYNMALEMLRDRYDNSKLIIQGHIKAIFDLRPLSKDSSAQIRNLHDELSKNIRALQNLKVPVEHCNAFISHILMQKLDDQTRIEFSKLRPREIPSLLDIETFLRDKSQLVEELKETNYISFNQNKPKERRLNQPHKLSLVAASQPGSCSICNQLHSISRCPSFLAYSIQQRSDTIDRLNKCKNCLGHPSNSKCNSRFTCQHCHKRHHTLLHPEQISKIESQHPNTVKIIPSAPSGSAEPSQVALPCYGGSSQILLSTACVNVKNSEGRWVRARAILDTGSMNSFITESLLNTLNLKHQRVNATINGINAATSQQVNFAVNIHFSSIKGNYEDDTSCLVVPKICSYLPSISFNRNCIDIPTNIELADNHYNKSAPIDLLLGVSIFYKLLCIGQISLGKNQPTLQKTLLGWIVSGNMINNNKRQHSMEIPSVSISNLLISNEELDKGLIKFWQIEEVTPKSKLSLLSQEELFCENHFNNTTIRKASGRFSVSIPFNSKLTNLGESRIHAVKRFLRLEKRLANDPELKLSYSSFINEYISLGHMSKINTLHPQLDNSYSIKAMNVEIPSSSLPYYYLPHHAVIKTSSFTTKLRVVFDGSANSSSGISINHAQLVGPVVQDDLFSILIRFRQYSVALTGDIEKMYRQIEINPNERKLQCILWRDSPDKPIDNYELNTITYGTASASYLATNSLRKLAETNATAFPKTSNVLKKNFYVDDLLYSLPSPSEMMQIKREITEILASACFPIRKFLSNYPEILNNDCEDTDSYHTIPLGERESVKTLGVSWNAISDHLQFEIRPNPELKTSSKRSVLSIASQLFDPLGLLAPITIRAKILIQRLWEAKLDWDESLPQSLHSEWESFNSELPLLTSLKFPRCVIPAKSDSVELHGFADSSSIAYGACIYVRVKTSSNQFATQLLCAKSRVAPLKGATIPRLELSAAVLLSELMQRVQTAFDGPNLPLFFWTDSTIVLNWINSAPNKYKIFVANRIATIQESTRPSDWHHVRSQNNPADLVSRGISAQSILKNELWRHGPGFLKNPISDWPKSCINNSNIDTTELKPICLLSSCDCLMTCLFKAVDPGEILFTSDMISKFSSLTKLKRVVAWLIRFKYNCQNPKQFRHTGPLTVNELKGALEKIIKNCQNEMFLKEINSLHHHQFIKGKSSISALNPFLDESGLLRVGGRLQNSDFQFDKKFPILLPKQHHLTNLIFCDYHLKLQHCGAQQLLYCVREIYWPISGKNEAKKVVRKCIKCFKANPSSYNPLMGNLPTKRLHAEAPVFYNTGLDYAGPILIRDRNTRGSKSIKAYICLFICMTTKAVHLELVTDLTTEGFLLVLKRFISRRGMPHTLSSDNATNFVGACNHLKDLYDFLNCKVNQDSIHDYLAIRGIKWEFIIPRNPHEGGMWESNIKSTKSLLKRVLGNTCLSYEQFSTVLTQIESVLNSRPLSPLSSDPNDLNPLTPGHFLIGRPLSAIPENDITSLPENRLSKYQRVQQITQHFWKRWSSEVVPNMQRRTKWFAHLPDLVQVDKLVLIKDDNTPVLAWPLGRVVSVHVGKDNVIRSASVRVKNGSVIKRSVVKLCALPD